MIGRTNSMNVYYNTSNIVETSVSGNPAILLRSNGGPLIKCIASWDVKQSGSGTPSPENIRPFSGLSNIELTQTGKNLINLNDMQWGVNITYTDAKANFNSAISKIKWKSNTQYTISFNSKILDTSTSCVNYLMFYYTDGTMSSYGPSAITNSNSGIEGHRTNTSASNKTISTIKFIEGTGGKFSLNNLQIEEGIMATEYEEYKGNNYAIALPEIIWAGNYDMVNGTGNKIKMLYTFKGTENYRKATYSQLTNTTMIVSTQKPLFDGWWQVTAVSSHFIKTDPLDDIESIAHLDTSANIAFKLNKSRGITDENLFKEWLADQNSKGTPVQVVLTLLEPIAFTDIGMTISTLQNKNTLSSNADNIVATYSKYI